MKDEIIKNLNKPRELEKLYRNNKASFKKEFNLIYEDFKENPTAQTWNERLNFENDAVSFGSRNELIFVILASVIATVLAKIPEFTGLDPESFYVKNSAFIVFSILTVYFSWRQQNSSKNRIICAVAILLSLLYINLIPEDNSSDTYNLSTLHIPLFLWLVLGFSFVGDNQNNWKKRLEFLSYNGDLIVMITIILIAGGLLTGMSIGLFELIDIKIYDFYLKYIVVGGLAACPIVASYLILNNPQLVNKVSPIIAKVFTPLVLITLMTYLFAVLLSGKSPYNDRYFLLLFNLLLILVMAIIFFSIAETSKNGINKIGINVLFALSVVTIILNGIALSAILFRISEWGVTPNRLAILGSNILILSNLLLVSYQLFRSNLNSDRIEQAEKLISSFLPIYGLWTIIVSFVFPILFNYK